MMRSGVRCVVECRFWNHNTKPNAAAITASVKIPIRTKFARVSIKPTPVQLVDNSACALAVEIFP